MDTDASVQEVLHSIPRFETSHLAETMGSVARNLTSGDIGPRRIYYGASKLYHGPEHEVDFE